MSACLTTCNSLNCTPTRLIHHLPCLLFSLLRIEYTSNISFNLTAFCSPSPTLLHNHIEHQANNISNYDSIPSTAFIYCISEPSDTLQKFQIVFLCIIYNVIFRSTQKWVTTSTNSTYLIVPTTGPLHIFPTCKDEISKQVIRNVFQLISHFGNFKYIICKTRSTCNLFFLSVTSNLLTLKKLAEKNIVARHVGETVYSVRV